MSTVQKLARSRRVPDEPIAKEHRPATSRIQPKPPTIHDLVQQLPHVRYLHLLLFAGISTASFIYFCMTTYPQSVANVLFYHSYLPFTALFFSMIFFIFSFLLLNTRRGLVLALFSTSLLFFRLQDIELTFFTVLVPCVLFSTIEISSHLAFKK